MYLYFQPKKEKTQFGKGKTDFLSIPPNSKTLYILNLNILNTHICELWVYERKKTIVQEAQDVE